MHFLIALCFSARERAQLVYVGGIRIDIGQCCRCSKSFIFCLLPEILFSHFVFSLTHTPSLDRWWDASHVCQTKYAHQQRKVRRKMEKQKHEKFVFIYLARFCCRRYDGSSLVVCVCARVFFIIFVFLSLCAVDTRASVNLLGTRQPDGKMR